MSEQQEMVTISTQAAGFRKSKNIVICSDGTGQRGGPGRASNVWRTYLAVDPTPDGGPLQVRIHDDGVGTQDFIVFKLIGGAFGWGISRNLRRLYTELILTWNPGDKIYLFGFSRGAYTVRVLAQMICLFGIPSRVGKTKIEIERMSREALDSYNRANNEFAKSDAGYSETAASYKEQNVVKAETSQAAEEPLIHFIGCWDTVGAVGFPIESVTRAFTALWRLRFRSNGLNHLIEHARHALAIDDERRTFQPTLWDESGLGAHQTVKQVWFPGMHSDVGGSYAKDEMSHVSLLWMLKEAHNLGLKLHDAIIEDFERVADAFGKMHDSRSGLGAYYRYQPRRIEDLCQKMSVTPTVHASTLHRVFAKTESYAPKAITNDKFEIEESGPYLDNDLRPDRVPIERSFDFIWINRGTYFLFLAFSIVFVWLGWWLSQRTEPIVFENTAISFIFSIFACIEVPLLKLGIAFSPGLLTPILEGYFNFPGGLTMILATLAGLLFLTRRLFELTDIAAAKGWEESRAELLNERPAGDSVTPVEMKLRFVARAYRWLKNGTDFVLLRAASVARIVRTNDRYQKIARFWERKLVPLILLVLVVAFSTWGIRYTLSDGVRWLWAESHSYELPAERDLAAKPSEELTGRKVIEFPIDDSYHDTELRLIEGAEYKFTVREGEPWIDADRRNPVPQDPEQKAQQLRGDPVKGLENPEDASWSTRQAQNLLKRVKGQEIFIMIASIGPDADTLIPFKNGELEFIAPRSGRLFLFVNDVPGFYKGSNQGTAIVTIEPSVRSHHPEQQ